jgi:hypothetical protein
MQINRNAAVIRYRESKAPRLLGMLSMPKLEDSIIIEDGTQSIRILFIDCQVSGGKLDKKRYRILKELVESNKAEFIVECFFTQAQSNVTPKRNAPHYTELLKEVRAIKKLAALMKLSEEEHRNLLAGNIGFLLSKPDYLLAELLTEEAENVMFYEGTYMTDKERNKIHQSFMEKRGISIIFTKDIQRIIKNCEVLAVDEGLCLEGQEESLRGKILLGRWSEGGSNIIQWNEEPAAMEQASLPWVYNDEILAIIRYCNLKMEIVDFIQKLPYIYLDPC